MQKSETLKTLASALVKFQAAIEAVAKGTQGYGYKYADLPSIWNYIRPHLAANGLAVVQCNRYAPPIQDTITRNKKGELQNGTLLGVIVETTLLHESGEWISDECYLPYVQADPQGAGSAITYARRYGLAAILGIVADEDDDGAKALGTGKDDAPANKRSNTRSTSAPKNNPAMEKTLAKAKETKPAAAEPTKDHFGTGAALKFKDELTELCRGLNASGDSTKWSPKVLDEYVTEQFDEPLALLSAKNVAIVIGDLEERLKERQGMMDDNGITPSHSGPAPAGDAINERQIDTIGKLCGLKDLQISDVALQYSDDRTDDINMLTETEAAEAIKGIQKAGKK